MTSNKKKTIFAGIFGNALEWYDFTSYAFFAPILASLFFPSKNQYVSLLMAFGVFALSFLVRPIGALIFGYIGDHFGRKNALIISIIVMTVPTLILGLLPSYAVIGISAPILLTFFRLIQGLAVSGELTSATSFLVEHAHANKRGLMGSLAMCSAFVGIVTSSAVVTLITDVVSHEQLLSWGWRLPFLVGGLAGLVGLKLRLKTAETLHYQQAKQTQLDKNKPSFFQHYFELNYKPIFLAIMLTAIMAIGNYLLIGYFNTFLMKIQGHPINAVMTINFICLLLLTILLPILGMVSDKIGRKPVLATGIIGLILCAYPSFWLLQQPTMLQAFWGELLFTLALAPISALIPTTLAEMFHVHTRNSGVSLGYNTSLAIFGGTAPLIAIELVSLTKSGLAPAWYVIAGGLISLLALWFLTESYQKELG